MDSKPKIQRVIHELSELASTDSDHVKPFFNAELCANNSAVLLEKPEKQFEIFNRLAGCKVLREKQSQS